MTRRFHLELLIILLVSPLIAAADNKIVKETFESGGAKRTYYLFVPKSIADQKAVPLLILLHGSNRNGISLAEKWKDLAEKEGFIIVAPDASEAPAWRIREDGPEFLRGLVERLWAKYPINHRRVYLFGHSAGAVFAIHLSMMESEYFAAAAIHAGSWRSPDDFTLMDYAARKSPLAVFVGDKDPYFPLDSVKATHAALQARGFPVETSIIKGHDHWYYNIAPEINVKAWEFLKRHELANDPKYANYNFSENSADLNATLKAINELRIKINESLRSFHLKEAELRAASIPQETVSRLAKEQIELLNECEKALRASSEKSAQLSKPKLSGNFAEYFSLLGQVDLKRLDAVIAMRERAALRLTSETAETRIEKMNAAAIRIAQLNNEADELQLKADLIRGK